MEDVDLHRCSPAHADSILRTLEIHALEWDGEILYQSTRFEEYQERLDSLFEQGVVYACRCSRKILERTARRNDAGEFIYPGTCAPLALGRDDALSMRFRTPSGSVEFVDEIQGLVCQEVAQDVGDFVLFRGDGLYSYQWAVVIDDAFQGITDIVRGCDLLDSTPRQIVLQKHFGLSTPRYNHVPIVLNLQGEKLSKQTRARALADERASQQLCGALKFLGQDTPEDLPRARPYEILAWAMTHWNPQSIPHLRGRIWHEVDETSAHSP